MRSLWRIGFMALLLALAGAASAEGWPKEIEADEGTLVIYQPQPESLEGNVLKGRAALQIEVTGQEPVFGAMWFESRIDTDHDTNEVTIRDIKVTKTGWPDSKDAAEQRLVVVVENAFPDNGMTITLERLSASLDVAEREQKSLEDINNDPPEIVFSDELAVLLIYDGKPRFEDIEGSNYERAQNTPFAVARNKNTDDVYLTSGSWWYRAHDPLGPFLPVLTPPADLAKMTEQAQEDAPKASGEPPKVVVATEPTELISSQGKPEWQSLAGGALLYVTNTETPLVRELETGNMYVLLSGRWYRSKSTDGPWTFVRADELPTSFQDIPPDSPIGGLRTSVAGTEEAEDAMLDADIPQTAAINRKEATLSVEYDGKPKFERIDGTDVSYAVNTATQVLEIDDRYYAVDNGVWFTSRAATGPWVVADALPDDQIAEIPPSSPVYNTTYVKVYDSTPDVVYVGYTPGYMWSFPYYGVPIYGTGWYYPPYWGGWYYPRPPTWGFHVGYNPWTGWNYGVSWSNGFFSIGVGWSSGPGWGCCGGWYGGGPTFINNDIDIDVGDINIGNNVNIGNRTEIGNRISERRGDSVGALRDNKNLYNRDGNRNRLADTGLARRDLKTARPATGRDNNVFADRSGNIARQTDRGWETRNNGRWDRPSTTRPSTGAADRSFNRSSFDRASRARSRGMSRTTSRRSFGGGRGGFRR